MINTNIEQNINNYNVSKEKNIPNNYNYLNQNKEIMNNFNNNIPTDNPMNFNFTNNNLKYEPNNNNNVQHIKIEEKQINFLLLILIILFLN